MLLKLVFLRISRARFALVIYWLHRIKNECLLWIKSLEMTALLKLLNIDDLKLFI